MTPNCADIPLHHHHVFPIPHGYFFHSLAFSSGCSGGRITGRLEGRRGKMLCLFFPAASLGQWYHIAHSHPWWQLLPGPLHPWLLAPSCTGPKEHCPHTCPFRSKVVSSFPLLLVVSGLCSLHHPHFYK